MIQNNSLAKRQYKKTEKKMFKHKKTKLYFCIKKQKKNLNAS